MNKYEEIEKKLSGAVKLLDQCCNLLKHTKLDKKKNMRNIGQALSNIIQIQNDIYKLNPELLPEFLKKGSPWPESSKKLSRIMAEADIFEEDGNIEKAKALYISFINGNHPKYLIDIAKKQLEDLKS